MPSKLLLGGLGGAVAVGAVVAIVAASSPGGGAASRASDIAVAFPADVSAFVALLEPQAVIDAVAKRVPEVERKRLAEELGFAPISVAGWRGAGVDLSRPVAFGMIDLEEATSVFALRAAGQPGDLKRFVDPDGERTDDDLPDAAHAEREPLSSAAGSVHPAKARANPKSERRSRAWPGRYRVRARGPASRPALPTCGESSRPTGCG